MRRGPRDEAIGDQLSLPAAAGEGLSELLTCPASAWENLLPIRLPLRRGATTSAKRSLYGPGDGEIAGVALPAGKTPAPESGTAEEPADAWTGVAAGEDPGED